MSAIELAHLMGIIQGFLLALPAYLVLDALLDHLTRRADGVGHDEGA